MTQLEHSERRRGAGLVTSLAPRLQGADRLRHRRRIRRGRRHGRQAAQGRATDIVILTSALVAKLADEKLVSPPRSRMSAWSRPRSRSARGDPSHGERRRRSARGVAGRGRDLRAGHQGLDRRHPRRESAGATRHRRRSRKPPEDLSEWRHRDARLASSNAKRPIGCTQATEIISTDGIQLSACCRRVASSRRCTRLR